MLNWFHDFLHITCTVLKWQVPEIEVYISEHSPFPSVNVWVWPQGAWKQHPCNSNAMITIFFKPNLLFPFLFLFPFYFLFIPLFPDFYSLFPVYSLFPTSLSACLSISMHVHIRIRSAGSLQERWMMNTSLPGEILN